MTDKPFTDLVNYWTECEEKEMKERGSWAHPAMGRISDLTAQLQNDGWADVGYCPKDGSIFLAWGPTSKNPYRCSYEGEWPGGGWCGYLDGDAWPVRPSLWKPLPKKPGEKDE